MTKNELNRDVKRLYKQWNDFRVFSNTNEYKEWMDKVFKHEYRRLYMADTTLKYITKDNLLRMVKMNQHSQVIPPENFGLFIEIEN